jgi:tetratricopeptide (TPR) repeat protein
VVTHDLFDEACELESAGRLAEAEERWREAVRVMPSGATLARLGRACLRRGAIEEGERWLREAIARFPDDSVPYFHLGAHYLYDGDLQESRDLLQKSVDLREWAPALVCLGEAHYRLDQEEIAQRCFERATAADPEDAEAWYLLGLGYRDHDRARAAELFQKAIDVDPKYDKAWRELGLILWLRGEVVAAEEHVRRALALDDRSAWNHDYLGVILDGVGRHQEGAQAIRRALEIWPDCRLFYCQLGDALISLGEDEDGEAAFKRALALDLNHYLANLRMGQYRRDQGRIDEARTYMERARRAWPDNEQVLRALSTLPPVDPDPAG